MEKEQPIVNPQFEKLLREQLEKIWENRANVSYNNIKTLKFMQLKINKNMKKETENPNPLVSLFEYYGRAVGKEKGADVVKFAMTLGVKPYKREVRNSTYSGYVNLYTREFLNVYENYNGPRV
jgi:hypothetical protein